MDEQIDGDAFTRFESEEDWKNFIREKYLEAEKLLDGSPENPINRPYEYKYKARELLRELLIILRSHSCVQSGFKEGDLLAMIAGIHVSIASVDIDVEEPVSAESNLDQALKILETDASCPLNIILTISALNQLGLLWSSRSDVEKALKCLQRAENLYLDFIKTENEPIDVKTLFVENVENNGKVLLDKLYTYTLYYLAQVFKSLNLDEKSALYCHSTLKRQVDEKHDFNKITWALNSATLSQYLAERFAFKEARHHLAAAEYFIKSEEEFLDTLVPDTENYSNLRETLERGISDVSWCWAKYCLLLLCTSRDRLMGTKSEDHGDPCPPPPKDLVGLCFPTLNLKEFENLVAASFILDMDDAKKVFLFGLKCCNKALERNSLDGHVTDHVKISQDISQLYQLLAFYEDNEDSQSKMHKRRKDLLSKVAVALNPQYYLDLCRGLWMELGTICSSMSEIKLMKVNSTSHPETKAIIKCNRILQEGIDYVEKFIDSYNDQKKKALPPRYPVEVEKEIISAYFLLANMYMKFLNADKVKVLYYHSRSLDLYKVIVDYGKRNQEFESMVEELRLAEEMVLLLNVKIERIKSQIQILPC